MPIVNKIMDPDIRVQARALLVSYGFSFEGNGHEYDRTRPGEPSHCQTVSRRTKGQSISSLFRQLPSAICTENIERVLTRFRDLQVCEQSSFDSSLTVLSVPRLHRDFSYIMNNLVVPNSKSVDSASAMDSEMENPDDDKNQDSSQCLLILLSFALSCTRKLKVIIKNLTEDY